MLMLFNLLVLTGSLRSVLDRWWATSNRWIRRTTTLTKILNRCRTVRVSLRVLQSPESRAIFCIWGIMMQTRESILQYRTSMRAEMADSLIAWYSGRKMCHTPLVHWWSFGSRHPRRLQMQCRILVRRKPSSSELRVLWLVAKELSEATFWPIPRLDQLLMYILSLWKSDYWILWTHRTDWVGLNSIGRICRRQKYVSKRKWWWSSFCLLVMF